MTSKTREAISRYYAVLRDGIDSGFIQIDALPFADEITIVTSSYKIVGKEDVFSMFQESINAVKEFELKEIFTSNHTACAIVEFSLFNDPLPILTADWFHLKDGQIVKLFSIYDSATWEKVIQT